MQSRQVPVGIRQLIHHPRPLVSLRDPADAIYSCYVMDVRDGYEQRTLARVLEQLTQDLGSDPTRGPFHHQQLSRFCARVPRHKIRVNRYDDLRRDTATVIRTMFRQLEVDAGFQRNTPRVANAGGLRRNRQLNTLLKCTALGRRIPARVNKRL